MVLDHLLFIFWTTSSSFGKIVVREEGLPAPPAALSGLECELRRDQGTGWTAGELGQSVGLRNCEETPLNWPN